jgi:uncharacterized protein YkwD
MILIGALLFGVGTAFGASNFLKTLQVMIYPDLSIYFNGVKDSPSTENPGYYNNGTSWVPKTMIYQGTTYVPMRYFANQLGIANDKIGWDEATHAIWVGSDKPTALVTTPTPTTVPISTPSPTIDSVSNKKDFPSETKNNFGIYGFYVGETSDQLRADVGEPTRIAPFDWTPIQGGKVEYWIYNNNYKQYVWLKMMDDKIVMINSATQGWKINNVTSAMTEKDLCAKGLDGFFLSTGDNRCQHYYSNDSNQTYQVQFGDTGNYNTGPGIHAIGVWETGHPNPDGSPEVATKAARDEAIVKNTFDRINVARVEHNLQPLIWNDQAAKFALDHSNEQINSKNFKAHIHEGLNGDSFETRMNKIEKTLHVSKADETVENTFGDISVELSFDALDLVKNEDITFSKILDSKANQIGIGLVRDDQSATSRGYSFTLIFLTN